MVYQTYSIPNGTTGIQQSFTERLKFVLQSLVCKNNEICVLGVSLYLEL